MEETPRQLGRYELVRRIAVGGMGEIYLARVRGTAGFEKTVIIKTILPHLAEQEEFVDKFLDEGRIVVNLTHGNIVPVFDMDEVDGEYFIAMDYVPGRDLRDVLKRLGSQQEGDRERGAMQVELAVYVISEVCDGLAYAHRKTGEDGEPLNIVHRDVSPSNILLSTEGEVKVIDFGIARAADRRAETVSGRIQGKCCYMSPEQATGKSIDHRSDIFSTGVVLYEMLTGVRPFEGDTDLQSLDLVRRCNFEPPSAHNETVPEEVDAIVHKALSKDLEERYQSIDQMHVDLMQFLFGQGQALTSQAVADFLHEVYPGGAERDLFRQARGSGGVDEGEGDGGDDGPVGLDDALNKQFEQLEAGAFAGESDGELAAGRTPTDRESGSGGSDSAEKGAEGPLGIDPVGRTATLTPVAGETPASDERDETSGVDSGGTTAPERPGNRENEEGTDTGKPDGSESRPLYQESGSRPIPAGEPGDSETTGTTGTGSFREGPPVGTRRWVTLAAVVGLLLGAGLIASYVWVEGRGTVVLQSSPEGARVVLDGSELVGRQTPTEVRLRPGQHDITLEKSGFRPRRFRVEIAGGEEREIEATLKAEAPAEGDADGESREGKESKSFRVTTEPSGARLWVNQQAVGKAPIDLKVAPGETKFVEARTEGCERAQMPIFYGRPTEKVTVRLECGTPAVGPDEGEAVVAAAGTNEEETTTEQQRQRPPARVSLRFETRPEGVTVSVNGNELGESPFSERFLRQKELKVTLQKEGYQSQSFTVTPGEVSGGTLERTMKKVPTGCLNFFAVHPQYNEFAIDGTWLDGRHQALKNYELPAGEHTVRVRNPDAGKDESFRVSVEPGEKCATKTVWDE